MQIIIKLYKIQCLINVPDNDDYLDKLNDFAKFYYKDIKCLSLYTSIDDAKIIPHL